jgi:hypothetical protein
MVLKLVSKENEIIENLGLIMKELSYIKKNMLEKDEIMNEEEFLHYNDSFDEKNLMSLKDAKKVLGF